MAEALLQVKDLKKYFKTPGGMLHAVDGITFDLEEGKTLGVVGESGCGKSTLGRVILGLLDATSGSVLFQGSETIGVSKHQRKELRKNMQIIFQDPFSSLNPRMCVSELIAEPLKVYGVCKSKAERDKRVAELMETVGLAERLAFAYPHELDGGRRQRIGVARALALNPKFIVCDEPVSALDVSIQAQILNLLQDLQEQQGLTYIFITHDLSVVKHISDDILVMYVGSMVEKCPADEHGVPCDIHKEGQEFEFDFERCPANFCAAAFHSLWTQLRVLELGGRHPWDETPGVTRVACPDSTKPTIFRIETWEE